MPLPSSLPRGYCWVSGAPSVVPTGSSGFMTATPSQYLASGAGGSRSTGGQAPCRHMPQPRGVVPTRQDEAGQIAADFDRQRRKSRNAARRSRQPAGGAAAIAGVHGIKPWPGHPREHTARLAAIPGQQAPWCKRTPLGSPHPCIAKWQRQ